MYDLHSGQLVLWAARGAPRHDTRQSGVTNSMKLEGEQALLRIYLRNTDKHGWSAASDVLVERAKKKHLAGATVLRGVFGLDIAGKLLETGRWSLIDHVPVVVEIVDHPHNIGPFLADVDEIVPE